MLEEYDITIFGVGVVHEEIEEFIGFLNQYDSSIYKWCYAKEIDYTYDPRYEDGTE